MNAFLDDHIPSVSLSKFQLPAQTSGTVCSDHMDKYVCMYTYLSIRFSTKNLDYHRSYITFPIQLERAMPQAMGKGSSRRCLTAKIMACSQCRLPMAPKLAKVIIQTSASVGFAGHGSEEDNIPEVSGLVRPNLVVAPELLDLAVQLEVEHGTETQAMSEIVLPALDYWSPLALAPILHAIDGFIIKDLRGETYRNKLTLKPSGPYNDNVDTSQLPDILDNRSPKTGHHPECE